jgi:hypothetical protein
MYRTTYGRLLNDGYLQVCLKEILALPVCRFVQPQKTGIMQRWSGARPVEVERSRPILSKVQIPTPPALLASLRAISKHSELRNLCYGDDLGPLVGPCCSLIAGHAAGEGGVAGEAQGSRHPRSGRGI